MRYPEGFPVVLYQLVSREPRIFAECVNEVSWQAVHQSAINMEAYARHDAARKFGELALNAMETHTSSTDAGKRIEAVTCIITPRKLFNLLYAAYCEGRSEEKSRAPDLPPITSESWNNACAGLGTKG